ncbi:hypothetical protein [Actinophytocola sp.]|uniref:hypothetical protein n=1 Tax=Actinophytocola sp. TaxID=1872138 RepID=UPI002D7E550E|nr:hypothetical protein [Actinophytocola sp.]HET9144044.1 hypothetical protein [Actinophytocola sp.]
MAAKIDAITEYNLAVANVEFREQRTVLRERITVEINGRKQTIGAISSDGRWGYDREGRNWVAFPRDPSAAGTVSLSYHSSLDAARRWTFDLDHPVHTVPRAPQPVRYEVYR